MIDSLYEFGAQIILTLQNLAGWLIPAMRQVTFLGDEEFFLLVMPALYWCIDAALGVRLGLVLLVSESLNFSLRLVFHTSRPYWAYPHIRAYDHETTFGIPSSHAQNAAAVWGFLAAQRANLGFRILLGALVALIGLSRVFLGVHFPHDVILGWLFGFLVMWLFLRLEAQLKNWLARQSLGMRFLAALLLVLALVLPGVLLRFSLNSWQLPATWVENAARAVPDGDPINPLSLSVLLTPTGALLGLAWGALWSLSSGGYDAGGSWGRRLARFPIGLVGVVILWFGLGAVFPRGEFLLAYLLRFLRYFLVGLWVSALAPLLFVRLGLAQPARPLPGASPLAPSVSP